MNRSRPESDLSRLEAQLRVALHRRADSTRATGHSLDGLRTDNAPTPLRRPTRRLMAAAAVIATAAALVVIAETGGETRQEIATTPDAPGSPSVVSVPEPGLPRLIIEGSTFTRSEGEGASPIPDDPAVLLQAFRGLGRLDGPMIFLTTLRPYDPGNFGLIDESSGDPVDVRGRVGYLSRPQETPGSTGLSVELGDGTAIYVTAVGVGDAELVAFLDGLTDAPDGRWMPTSTLLGLTEVPIAPLPADGAYYGGAFELPAPEPGELVPAPLGAVDVNLYQDGFESRLADRVSSTVGPVEAVSVDGVPAALGPYSDTDWWVLMEPEPGRALELRIPGDRLTVEWVLSHARFVDEATWDSLTGSG